MKKQKPYYLIIVILFLTSIIVGVFLPYLHLTSPLDEERGYHIDYKVSALNSNVITKIAKKEGISLNIVYNTAKNIVAGKNEDAIKSRLKENEYFVIDLIEKAMDNKITELEEIGSIEETTFSYFGLIKLSFYVIRHLEQNVISAYNVILTLIMIVVISVLVGVKMMIQKHSYGLVKIASLVNIILSTIGLISVNAITIGALQLDKFYRENWGIGYFIIIAFNIVIFIISFFSHIYEKYEGIVTLKMIIKQKELIFMSIPFVLYAFIFYYGPLVGWIMAFQNYKPAAGSKQVWVAWDKFKILFLDIKFLQAFRNTVAMSMINLVLSTVVAILFALLLNEVINIKGKKLVQTISYLPHFLSWIIVAAIVRNVLSYDGGIMNEILVKLGFIDTSINFFVESKYFWWIIGFAVIWKETGWNSIIYLSSITSINPDLYESAAIDGAGRLQKMIHITLPGIKPTILVLLIINLGMIMNSGYEAQYLLKNDLINNTAEVIETFVLNKSFYQGADWSIGTAAGIFKSVVSIFIITIANQIAKIFGEERLY